MSTTSSGRAQRLLDDQIEPFLQHLRSAGYAERTLRKKRTVARSFARWARGKGIATIDLNDGLRPMAGEVDDEVADRHLPSPTRIRCAQLE